MATALIPPPKVPNLGKPVGELKKLVSLVDRSDFDNFVFPADADRTAFQPDFKPYHNFTQDTLVLPFTGEAAWGKRITFAVPWPWQGDFINWIALRLKPYSWLSAEAQRHLGPDVGDWVLLDPANFYIWANSLGTIAIERAEMEIDGQIVEQFSGDWTNVWNRTAHDVSASLPFDDAMYGAYTGTPTQNRYQVSEDGYVYCYIPFSFAKFQNTAFPLVSKARADTVRFHITLRPFHQVIRKLSAPLACDETPLGKTIQARDYLFPFRVIRDIKVTTVIPGFQAADLLLGVTYIDGELRKAYVERPHEILVNPVTETYFAEPLKYVANTLATTGDQIRIQLPITTANGPIRQLIFFLRRNATVQQFNDWNNYSATLANEADPVWNPERPLLVSAQLQVGTAVWADEGEEWWRAASNILMPGGIRGYGSYIYAYNFAEKPAEFSPSGSVNASRTDIRLNLTVAPQGGASDGEWTVTVFVVGTNWFRFQNGLANLLFAD